ncbi:TPA: thioredoxin family protein [bacterium]|nr:thioredoxin family protein [bacterium]
MKQVILITSLWCPSCLIMRPKYEKLFKEVNIDIIEYDYDEDIEIVKKYNIGKILPVLIIKEGGLEVARVIGEKKKKELKKLMEEFNNG